MINKTNLFQFGIFLGKWMLTTFCLVGAYSCWTFWRVNAGYEFRLVTPQYPQLIDYGYSDEPPARMKDKKK